MNAERLARGVGIGLLLFGVLMGVFHWVTVRAESRTLFQEDGRRDKPLSPDILAVLEGPGCWLVYLVGPREEMPAEVAPVVRLHESGRLHLVRGVPADAGPERMPWLAAAVVLPGESLAGLTAEQRVGLVDVLGAVRGPGRLAVDQLVPLGVEVREGERERLLRWLR